MPSRRFALGAAVESLVLAAALGSTASACPPSLTVATPPRGSAAVAGGAFLLVHAVKGCHPGPLTLSGTAEGLVGGERRTVALTLEPGGAADDYVVRRQWPREGVWVLRLTVAEGGGHATVLVGIGSSGAVATVRQPPRTGAVRDPSERDIASLLRSLAAG